MVIAAQPVSGVGGALILPDSLAILLGATLTDPHRRTAVITVWAASSSIGLALGPLLAGVLLGHFGRQAVFVPNAVLGVITLLVAAAFHQAPYRSSHNDILIRLLDDLWDKSDRYRRLGLELPPGDEPHARDLQEHHQLVSLIVDGRATEAAQLMRGHITHSLTATDISALEDREGSRVT